MRLEIRDGLLVMQVRLAYHGRVLTVDNMIVDTGAVHTLIDSAAVEDLSLSTDEDDIIVTMAGIGGNDYAVRKTIDGLIFGSYTMVHPSLDFGNLGAHPGINGLLGLDILLHGRFVLDLSALTVEPTSANRNKKATDPNAPSGR